MRIKMYAGIKDFNIKRNRKVTLNDILTLEQFILHINTNELPTYNEINGINIMSYMYIPMSLYEQKQNENDSFLETFHMYLGHLSDLYQLRLLSKYTSTDTTLQIEPIYQNLLKSTSQEFDNIYKLLKEVK